MDLPLTEHDVASPSYKATLQKRYESPGWGASGHHHAEVVFHFANELSASTVLDYGCGRGRLKQELLERAWFTSEQVREYDPGIVGKDMLPEPADLLVATDVLEHIEPELLDNVLLHMQQLAKKGMFLIIALNKAKETLPDGRNAHLIIQPYMWWVRRLERAGFKIKTFSIAKGLRVWVKK